MSHGFPSGFVVCGVGDNVGNGIGLLEGSKDGAIKGENVGNVKGNRVGFKETVGIGDGTADGIKDGTALHARNVNTENKYEQAPVFSTVRNADFIGSKLLSTVDPHNTLTSAM